MPKGEPFYINRAHTVITGTTNISGKTTAVEAILQRSKVRSLVFLTKRGEKTFQNANTIPAYYYERFDWRYLRSLLESTMHEKLKFETPWIIKISKQAEIELKTQVKDRKLAIGEGLRMVRKLLGAAMQNERLKDLDRNMYTLLAAYLDIVLPVLESARMEFVDTLRLQPGINVMDLTEWYSHEEVQMLVIRSCMEQILEHENNVTVALPESWKLLPQGRNTPVKLYFEKFIREGATNGNYLIIDAQDLGGVDKAPLRQVSVWVMGRMMQYDEVERLLKQTLSLDIQPQEIQTLPLGYFLVAMGDKVTKVYVWPHEVPEDMAVKVAKGELEPEAVKQWILDSSQRRINETKQSMRPDFYDVLDGVKKDFESLVDTVNTLSELIKNHIEDPVLHQPPETSGESEEMRLHKTKYAISMEEKTRTVALSDDTAKGKIMWFAKEGFLDDWRSQNEIEKALENRAWSVPRISIFKALKDLVKDGLLGIRKTEKPQRYKLSPNVTFKEE